MARKPKKAKQVETLTHDEAKRDITRAVAPYLAPQGAAAVVKAAHQTEKRAFNTLNDRVAVDAETARYD